MHILFHISNRVLPWWEKFNGSKESLKKKNIDIMWLFQKPYLNYEKIITLELFQSNSSFGWYTKY